MPTYEYRCTTCGARFDYFQSITADALKTCPVSECRAEDESLKGKGEVRRIVSGGAGVVFRGEGFYLTDYVRKGGEGSKESKETKESSSEKTKADSSGTGEKSSAKASGGESTKDSSSS